jgi:4-hydroxy-tetrahydrodipicolinate synthase
MSVNIQGIISAMATAMHEDETVNEEEIRNHVNRLIENGIHGLFCLGTNGEFYALSREEKLNVIRIVVDENRKRVPLFAGTGCITTKETIELTQKAKTFGVDAVSIIAPYFAQLSQEGLYSHYKQIAEAVDIDIIIYNIPARTGINIDYKTVSRLSQIHNIVGIKDSSGNFDNMLRYIEETDRDFKVLSGNDSLILWNLMAGGAGGISGISNLFPKRMADIYNFWAAGDLKNAKSLQDSIRPIRDALQLGNPNSIVKRAGNLLGCKLGPARAPFIADPGVDKVLTGILEQYNETSRHQPPVDKV